MNHLRELFTSPEFYPLRIDFDRRLVKFVRMSAETYRDSVFLDLRTRHMGSQIEVRLDDLLLVARSEPAPVRRVHYILHTSFCCSTLLARYFELLPFCFVLKEPLLLPQMALLADRLDLPWAASFDLVMRLLTRTYAPNQMVVIKPNDWCNPLGRKLLEQNSCATITFLMTPLKHYLLAILKAEERRDWIRKRILTGVKEAATCPELAGVHIDDLTDAEAIAFMWLTHRFLCRQMIAGEYRSRVLVLNGEELAGAPDAALQAVVNICGLHLNPPQLRELVTQPSASQYSKDLARPYDASSRQNELLQLERCWGVEADAGVTWALAHGAPAGAEHW